MPAGRFAGSWAVLALLAFAGPLFAEERLAAPAAGEREGTPLASKEPAAAPAGGSDGWLDMHVHAAGIGAGGSGAFVGAALADSWRLPIYLRAFGVTRQELEANGDALVIERISAWIAESKHVGRAVVLALDGVVDSDGALDREATQVYMPNEFVAAQTARYANLCFGASINPHRADAIERLERAHAAGAVLLKWIPNIMGIDPAAEALAPFYRRLAALGLPLLSHAGQERSFAHADDALGDPRRLALPLSLGVTVIAAHIATTGSIDGEANFERLLPMFERHPNLYADVSSLTQINKRGYLQRALARDGLAERLVYGTDWPLQFFPLVSPYYHLDATGWSAARAVAAIDNPWDRDIALKQALGVPTAVFARAETVLPLANCR